MAARPHLFCDANSRGEALQDITVEGGNSTALYDILGKTPSTAGTCTYIHVRTALYHNRDIGGLVLWMSHS
jgi:hypothetical protein